MACASTLACRSVILCSAACCAGGARAPSASRGSISFAKARVRVTTTSRLTLEPQTAAHADEMFTVLSDPAIYEYENKPPPTLEWLRNRFEKLETRLSGDGREQWLNWVIRLQSSELIDYVQATIRPAGQAGVAYELSSVYWGRGLAFEAVNAMIVELVEHYGVRRLSAVLKRGNFRSMRLLERLGFSPASSEEHMKKHIEPDEILMCMSLVTDGPPD